MTVLPSPIPHPLEHDPLDLPRSARETIECVLAHGWPAGDEAATWDVADRWYTLAAALAKPHDAAVTAAAEIMSSAGGEADNFRNAWQRLAGTPEAPLNALSDIAHELGQLVEQCGHDMEAAKLEALIEIGLLLTELTALAITAPLTMGAATPAADGLIASARLTLQQVFDRLAAQLAGQAARESRPPTTRQSVHPTLSEPDAPTRRLRPPSSVLGDATGTSSDATTRPAPATGATRSGSKGTTAPADVAEGMSVPGTVHAAAARTGAAASTSAPAPADAAMTGSGVELGDASGHSLREPAPQAASPRQGRHARRETSDSPSAPIRPTPRSADPADEPGLLHARRAAQIQRLPASVPAKSPSPYPPDVGAGPGTVTRRILPSELEQLADAIVRRDKGDDVGYSRDARRGRDHLGGESSGGPPAGDLTRRLARQQHALEEAMPRDGDGRIVRLADPRVGQWFGLVDDAGTGRGLNNLDGVLALCETYVHGRPRVAASSISDGPAGDVRLIERTIGSGFQNLCPFVGGADPAVAKEAVDVAMRNLANHLHNSGHGSFAFIVADLEGGGSHSWAAVNQDGDILFLDPQMGRISDDVPLYDNIVLMDALVVDGLGHPAPLPFHGRGLWSGTDG